MKKQTLWKRIFGQNPNKKVKAQQAFQEQFDTKLRFRELEPRVVLDATVDYTLGSDTLTITYTDAGDVTLGRDASGKLEIGGDSISFTAAATADFVGKLNDVGTINIIDNTGKASEFTLVGGVGTDALTGLVSNIMIFNNVDQVNVQDGADFEVSALFWHVTNSGDLDDNTINFDGKLTTSNLTLTASSTSTKSTSVTDTMNGSVTVGTISLQEAVGATGNLSLNLSLGDNHVTGLVANEQEVEIALADKSGNLLLQDINATDLSLTAAGSIFDVASTEVNVSGTASFSADSVSLNSSTIGHNFNKLTLNTTSFASIVETDGFDFTGLSIITGALTVNTGGAIGQTAGSVLRANSIADFTVGDSSAITLNEMANRFEGTVSVTGQTDRAGAVTFYDSNGGFQFGSTLATTLDLTTTGGISQTTDGIDVSGNAVFTTMGANAIVLNSANNAFGANVSATGNGGPAATLTIVDSLGTLTLDDIQTAILNATAINGGITQTGTGIKVTGTSSFTVQDGEDVTLTAGAANNAFGDAISISGASAAAGLVSVFQSTGDLKLGAIDATYLTIALDSGSISQTSAGVHVSKDAQFAVGDMKDILLNNSSNNVFGGELDLLSGVGTAASAAVNNSGTDLLLDQVKLSGDLTVVTNGGITQTNVGATDYVRVGGTSSFTVSNGANVELGTNTNNQFNTVSAQGQSGAAGTVSIADSDNGIILGAINAGTLNVSAATTIGQTAAGVVVTGTSSFTSGDGQDILLGTSGVNSFGDAVSASGATGAAGHVSIIASSGDLKLGAIDSASATLAALDGKIWQTSDGIHVAGNAQFTSGSGKDILLNTSSNNVLGGEVDLIGALGNPSNVALNNSGTGLLLDQVEASGNLTISTNGGITQTMMFATDYVQVGGTSSFTVSDGANIELGANSNNRFNVVNAEGQSGAAGDVLLKDSDGNLTLGDIVATNLTAENTAGGIVLGAIDATNLNVTSATNITQTTDGVKVSGVSKFDVSFMGSITLNEDGNEFNEIWASGSGFLAAVAKFKDSDSAANGITLGKIVVGDLQVTTVGEISDTKDEMLFFGIGTFDGGSLDFTNYTGAGHDFNAITLQIDGDAKFNEDSSLASSKGFGFLGDSSVGGQLEVTTTGIVEQLTGSLKVTGTTKITTPGVIELDEYTNDFQDSITLSGTTVVVYDANEIKLGNVTANSLEVHAKTGDIFQEMGTALDIETTTVARATTGFNVILGNDNDFTGSVSVVGFSNPTDVVLNDVNDLIIADIDSVTLTATAGMSITQQAGTSIKASTSADLTAGTTITLRDVTTPTLSLTAGDTISQEAGTSLLVSGMTMVEVTEGVTVDLSEVTNELGSISVNDSNTMAMPGMEVYAGTVTIYDGGNDNADAMLGTDDDGLTLKNIWADILTVTSAGTEGAIIQESGTAIHADKTGASSTSLTAGSTITTRDITTPMLNLTAGKGISQESGTALIVSGMTTVEVGTGENVDLSNADNDFGSIGVVGTGATAAGDVTIVDADGGIVLKDIIATNLMVTVNDTADVVLIDQMAATSLNVSGMATFVNNTGGNVLITQTGNQLNQVGATALGGIVSIYDAEGGIALKDIVASVLTVTVDDSMNVVNVTQVANTTINVSAGTSIDNKTGGNVDLSNAGNLLNTIFVSAVDMGVRGDVTIRDDDGGLVLASITAANLDVTVNDTMDVVNVTQVSMTKLDVTSMTTVANNTGGDIILANDDNLINQFGATTVRGSVSVVDSDGGIVLKDIVAGNLDVAINDTMDVEHVTQLGGAKLDVTSMTTVTNNTGGNILLGNDNLLNQFGAITDKGGARGDVVVNDVDGGIALKDIVAENLTVTVDDSDDEAVNITQVALSTIDVNSMSMFNNYSSYSVDMVGGDVILANSGNKFFQVGVIAEDPVTKYRGDVTIVDDDGGIALKDVVAGNLDVTVNDTVDIVHVIQVAATSLDVTSMTTVTNNTGGNILLGNDNTLNQFSAITNNGGVRGDVEVNDIDGGIDLKDIVAENLTVTVDDSDDEAVDISQVALATIDVNSMSLFNNYSSYSVDMVGGNVILANSDNKFYQIGVIAEDPVTKYRGDVTIVDDYDGLELKNIVAANLTVTVDDVDDDMVVELKQVALQTVDVSKMTMITNKTGGTVDLSNADNEIAQIMVTSKDELTPAQGDIYINDDANDLLIKNIIGNKLEAVAVGAISQLDGTSIVTQESVSLTSENSTITTGDITTPVLSLTADDDITQSVGTKLTVSMQTNLALTSKATIELLNVGNDLSKNVDLDLDGDDERIWDFEIRNENVDVNTVPTGDFEDVVKKGAVDDLTLEFVKATKLELPEINITDDLRIVIAGDLTQAGDILVGDTALFDAGSMILADDVSGTDLIVYGKATFIADKGDIEVGVKFGVDVDSLDRGKDAGTDVAFGSLNFSADGHHVTISEQEYDQPPYGLVTEGMDLVGDNVAKSAVLRSETDINDTAGSSLTVADLTSLYAENIVLGDSVDRNVDLRILYLQSTADVSIFENNDSNSLAIVDGSEIAGTLAIQTDGHIVQVNEFRTEAPDVIAEPKYNHIFADSALLVSNNGGILLTSTSFKTLAVSAGDTPLFVDADSILDLGTAGIASNSGFIPTGDTLETVLTTDVIDADLPDDNDDPFAVAARADSFVAGDGENYSIVIVDANDMSAGMDANGLVIGKVEDTTGGNVSTVNGIRTNGDDAGHVFVRSLGDGGIDGMNDGTLTFGTTDAGLVVGLANSGVITALARGNLSIATGSWLHVTDGADPDASAFALVSTIEGFTDNPTNKFELPNSTTALVPNEGPAYSRIPGNVDTYVLGTQTGKDSTATIVLDKLGTPGTPDELDFEVTLDFADTTTLQEEFYPQLIDSDTAILHDIPWEFATTNASTVVTLQAYNSPQINLFGNVVDDANFNNLNVIVDQFEIFFLTPIDYVPEMTNFVAPNNPYIAPIIPPEANPTPYASLTEIADDTRVATQIDGVTVVEVDPSDFMEKGEKIELDDDFMTLDAVKEYIQNGVQFPVGLYKIEILYPGSKEPEVYFYWKQDRLDPFDLFSNDTKPVTPRVVELAAANQATAQLSAEEVWAREYDKWFPGVAEQQPMDDLSVPAAEGDAGQMIPSDDDILLERVTTVSLQEIDRMTDRLRAKRSIVRDSLNGAMIGGAALMAAVAAQGRKDDEAPNDHPEGQGPQPEESLDETSLGRLRRRVRQWL
ncbi:hypothetical protein C5Y96_03485 [Blastopirellula marina]|uniref:Uncharacterized protein n=1 Tax=Blastopirellula marina TaxID=124 RepID=A0A2S8G3D9_9BACT|nr:MULTISPECIES: hypothetical protein [Pirellulaceae]PQO38947.1 hypothetical protein C5Y96_03485 [Blastopirellula marina]RCS55255.1 hypothetical protein DTL36_03490 [Bremerella cremea]